MLAAGASQGGTAPSAPSLPLEALLLSNAVSRAMLGDVVDTPTGAFGEADARKEAHWVNMGLRTRDALWDDGWVRARRWGGGDERT